MENDPAIDFRIAINATSEDLDVEFKRSLPLSTNEGKAKLAKEICALCNHGGGWIVLGRNDDGSYPASLPDELSGATQDTINQISSAYISPSPHCSAQWVSPDNIDFSVMVVRVPACGAIPCCGRKNGPTNDGKTVGIRKGVHYIRKAGPSSEEISSPEEWQSVIRRCVLSDKAGLLAGLTAMVDLPSNIPASSGDSILDLDISQLKENWLSIGHQDKGIPSPATNYVVYGFHFLDAQPATVQELKQCLQRRPEAIRSMPIKFFNTDHLAPAEAVVIENNGFDGLQALPAVEPDGLTFAWRLNEALCGAQVTTYWEDSEWLKSSVESKSSRKWMPGQAIWLTMQIGILDEFLSTTKHIADYFNYSGVVRILVEFHGLEGRRLDSPNPRVHYSKNYIAKQSSRSFNIEVDSHVLDVEQRSALIANAIERLNKITQGPTVTAATVARSLDFLSR